MKAIEVIEKISNTSLINSSLKYCLVDSNKHPYTLDNTPARPNKVEDFVEFDKILESKYLDKFVGIGISIQASEICAIDIDHCFSVPNEISSGDERAKYFLDLFKNLAYCEFSFSGTGLRILFKQPLIDNYSDNYYIKNEKYGIEYYQPTKSFRYVTVTGNYIYNNEIESTIDFTDKIKNFLDKYMKRNISKIVVKTTCEETRTYEELMKITKKCYRTDPIFQNLWFNSAPGSGKDESERDFHLVCYIYENITQDKELLKQIFESSEFYKTKDYKHIYKWEYNNFRYFNYLYENVERRI